MRGRGFMVISYHMPMKMESEALSSEQKLQIHRQSGRDPFKRTLSILSRLQLFAHGFQPCGGVQIGCHGIDDLDPASAQPVMKLQFVEALARDDHFPDG